MNAVEIEEAVSALAEQPFDGGKFPFAFLQAFGNKETTIKKLRAGASPRRSRTEDHRSHGGTTVSGESEDGDLASGTIYLLRSKSDDPAIVASRDVLHKIGVTGGDVKARIADARNDATYLLADVEIAATYKLANINRTKLENLIHRIFDPARLVSRSRTASAAR